MSVSKTPKESFVTMTELVMPNDTNMLFNVMGGKMMHWMDVVSAIAAQRHSNCVVVTASVDTISFAAPIKLGNVVVLEAKVTRAFKTSMEVHIEVWGEDVPNRKKFKSNSAFFTFVALDKDGNKVEIPEITPETEEEKEMYNSALQRRQLRLLLAGKIKASDATELKELFK